jgi:hypothetical protein
MTPEERQRLADEVAQLNHWQAALAEAANPVLSAGDPEEEPGRTSTPTPRRKGSRR